MADKSAKKPNIIVRVGKGIARFFRDTRGEMKKVVWPSRKQVLNNLVVVLVFVGVMALFVTLLDFAFGWLVQFVINLGPEASESVSGAISGAGTISGLLGL